MPGTNTTLSAGDYSTTSIVLSAAAVADLVTFGDDCEMVEVLNVDGSAALSFTVDGSVPVAGAKNTYYVPATAGAALEVSVPTSGKTKVSIVSTGTPTYRVTRTS